MKKTILILCCFFYLQLNAQTVHETPVQPPAGIPAEQDSIDVVAEDAAIEDIIQSRKAPQQEKVQYLSQLTKYGFKNLFSKYSFNPALPYSSQVNPYAESYMQDYLRAHSNSLVKMKSWGLPYFSLIDNIFTQYGLPRELKYLAVIESNLNSGATSWVGAGGPWQFMPYTARDYGLVVTDTYDERRDYIKSTHAAARYLLNLYKQMHDWLLVIAAYNGGPGRVYDAMKKSGSRNFWSLQYYLPEESRNHVKKFIATHYVMETNASLGSLNGSGLFAPTGSTGSPYNNKPSLTQAEAEQAETQTISGKFNSVIIAKNLAMDIVQFNRYNPSFDNMLSENGQYDLTLPSDKMQLFLANKYQILNECVQMLLGDNNIPNSRTVYPQKKKS
ncbi:MAG: lytic transglycosylase domain-containing protein [Bacteroidetes bacterium]|nr:lytic transglycosylase domain-containing protein [Bacteroidota bacterium]